MSTRPRQTKWFDPAELASTGIRAFVSGIFGEFADRREAQGSIRLEDGLGERPMHGYGNSDCQEDGSFWIDFIADTGDGWDQTYAMAKLLSKPEINVGDEILPRGKLLIMGGDQVYPAATLTDYETRLVDPFREAASEFIEKGAQPDAFGDLYAIPGNHDWYDSLRSFQGLFCRNSPSGLRDGKVIGARRTRQMRSYFAIRLPHDWWLWGVDSQLEGYIDQPQVDYFAHVAKERMTKESKLILCTGFPSWTNVDPANPAPRFASFSYMERLVSNYTGASPENAGTLKLAISGDTHHYARHVEFDDVEKQVPEAEQTKDGSVTVREAHLARHYVTCGGGGAYTHPTRQFVDGNGEPEEERFKWKWPKPGAARGQSAVERRFKIGTKGNVEGGDLSLYPSPATSLHESWKGLLFGFANWQFSLVFGALYALLFWQLGWPNGGMEATKLWDLIAEPWAIFHVLTIIIVVQGVADFSSKLARGAIGVVLAISMSALAFILTETLFVPLDWHGVPKAALAALVCGFASSTMLGSYFVLAFRFWGKQWNEVFAGINLTRYKSILRMKIAPDGTLTLHAIGLEETSPSLWQRLFGTAPVLPAEHLIESVEIK